MVWDGVRVGRVWVCERSMTWISPGPNVPGLTCQTQWASRPAPGVISAPYWSWLDYLHFETGIVRMTINVYLAMVGKYKDASLR